MAKFQRGKNWAGHRVTLDGELYLIDDDYQPGEDWCHIVKPDGTGRQRVAAGWAAQRASWFVADQSLVGQTFELHVEGGLVQWPCVDRFKGYFTLENPENKRRVNFSMDFLSHWKPVTAGQLVAINAGHSA
jgi:hypothetical protein